MDQNTQNTDLLENLFRQMPEEELPASFRQQVMQQVNQEVVKLKKRNERLELIATILGALAMFALAIGAFIWLEIPKIQLPKLDFSIFPFYIYIGTISLVLLFLDYKIRKVLRKDE